MATILHLVSVLLTILGCALPDVAAQEHVELSLGVETEQYAVSCNEYKYFKVDATKPCEDLRIQVNHVEGEPDLYVSRGPQQYPKFNSLAWSSYNWGSESLIISSWDPEYIIGTYYIGVLSYCGNDVGTGSTPAKFTLKAEHVETSHPHDELPTDGQVTSGIASEDYLYYRFCLPSSCATVNVALANCLDPTTCPTTYSYPELIVSRSIQRPTVNSHAWKLASVEVRSVTLTHDDPDVYPGHYFVGVYGWCTPDDLCDDPTTCGPCSYANNTEFVLSLGVTDITEGCTAKQPLELCSVDGADRMSASIIALTFSLLLACIIHVW